MICDFFKISGDNEAILDIRDSSKVQSKNASVQALATHRWDEVLSTVTDTPSDKQHVGETVQDAS